MGQKYGSTNSVRVFQDFQISEGGTSLGGGKKWVAYLQGTRFKTDSNHDVRKIIGVVILVNTITTSYCRDPRFSQCFEQTNELDSRIKLFLGDSDELMFFGMCIDILPKILVLFSDHWNMYAIPICVVGLAIEQHLGVVLVLYGGRQTPKLVNTSSARVETSARQG